VSEGNYTPLPEVKTESFDGQKMIKINDLRQFTVKKSLGYPQGPYKLFLRLPIRARHKKFHLHAGWHLCPPRVKMDVLPEARFENDA
jgi:hypothetical protein